MIGEFEYILFNPRIFVYRYLLLKRQNDCDDIMCLGLERPDCDCSDCEHRLDFASSCYFSAFEIQARLIKVIL